MSRPLLRDPLAAPLRHPLAAPGTAGPAIALIAITQGAHPGAPLTVTVADAGRDTDPATIQQLAATVVNQRTGESETLTLAETSAGSGVFAGGLATLRAAAVGSDDDGTMNAVAGDVLVARYDQPEPAGTRTAQTTLQGTVATVTMTATPAPGDTLDLTVADPDADTDPATPQQVAVTVSNATTGESETVTLTETGNATGVFAGTLATTDVTGAGSDDDGTLNVQGGDVLTASYADTAPAGVRTAEVVVVAATEIEFIVDSAIGGANGGTFAALLPPNCRTLVVVIFGSDGPAYPSFSNVQFNGVPLTKVAGVSANTGQTNNAGCEAWLVQDPDTGGAHDLSIDWSGGFISNRIRLFSVNKLVAVGGVGWNAEEGIDQTGNAVELNVTSANSTILTALAAEDNFLEGAAPMTGGLTYSVQNRTTTGISDLCVNSAFTNDAGPTGFKTISWSFAPGGSSIDGSAAIGLELIPAG